MCGAFSTGELPDSYTVRIEEMVNSFTKTKLSSADDVFDESPPCIINYDPAPAMWNEQQVSGYRRKIEKTRRGSFAQWSESIRGDSQGDRAEFSRLVKLANSLSSLSNRRICGGFLLKVSCITRCVTG